MTDVGVEVTEELRSMARAFVNDRLSINDLRLLRDGTHDGAVAQIRAQWKELSALGWPGMLVAERFGGGGGRFADAAAVLGELGAVAAVTPMLPTAVLAPMLLQRAASAELLEHLMPAIAAGDVCFAVAIDETPFHSPLDIASTAEQCGDGVRLNGGKANVVLGALADYLIVSARDTGASAPRARVLIVDAHAEGVSMEHGLLIDSQPVSAATFENVHVPREYVLAAGHGKGDGGHLLNDLVDWAAIALSAEILGAASRALEITVAYLKQRRQFGAVIGTFQALQHRAARLYADVEFSRGIVDEALRSADSADAKRSELASACKARTSELFVRVADEAIQLHGGIGMTDEADIGFYLKRARVSEGLYGDPAYHRDRFAQLRGY